MKPDTLEVEGIVFCHTTQNYWSDLIMHRTIGLTDYYRMD